MSKASQVIAIAGIKNHNHPIVSVLTSSSILTIVMLFPEDSPTLDPTPPKTATYTYTPANFPSLLKTLSITTLLIFLPNSPNPVTPTLLRTALTTPTLTHLIMPSPLGNIVSIPHLPRHFASQYQSIYNLLEEEGPGSEVQWTFLNHGWMMENFLPTSKDDEPGTVGFPINPNEWCASIPGTGNELQAWTSAGDVGKAIFALLGFESWEPVTYIVGEWGTFNQAISKLEGFYGHPMPKTHKSLQSIRAFIEENEDIDQNQDQDGDMTRN